MSYRMRGIAQSNNEYIYWFSNIPDPTGIYASESIITDSAVIIDEQSDFIGNSFTYPNLDEWEVASTLTSYILQGNNVYRINNLLCCFKSTNLYTAPISDVTNWSGPFSINTSGGGTWPVYTPGPIFINNNTETVYIYGGRILGNAATNSIFSASFSDLTSWTLQGTLPTTKAYLGLFVNNAGEICLVGGETNPPTPSTGVVYKATVDNPASVSNLGNLPGYKPGKAGVNIYIKGNYCYLINIGSSPGVSSRRIVRTQLDSINSWNEIGEFTANPVGTDNYSTVVNVYEGSWIFGSTDTDGTVKNSLRGWKNTNQFFYADPPTNSDEAAVGGGWFYDQDYRLYLLTSTAGSCVRSGLHQGITNNTINQGEYSPFTGTLINSSRQGIVYPEMRYQAIWWNTWPKPF